MKANRKKTEDYIIKTVESLVPGGGNKELYEKAFGEMSDSEFEQWMKDLSTGDKELTLQVGHMTDKKMSLERNFKIAKSLGHDFFQRLQMKPSKDSGPVLTPIKHMVLQVPNRRLAQTISKKMSAPTNMNVVDKLTGQPTNASKGAAVTFPDLQLLMPMSGMESTLREFMQFRGGDESGYNAMMIMLDRYGHADQATLKNYASGVRSKKTVKAFLLAAHIKNNL